MLVMGFVSAPSDPAAGGQTLRYYTKHAGRPTRARDGACARASAGVGSSPMNRMLCPTRLRALALGLTLLAIPAMAHARAGLESVTVRRAAGNTALLERRDGTTWRVTRGTDSLSVWAL